MRRFWFLLLFVCASAALHAQPASATAVALGHSVVALTGPWKFHIGDNPQWADPNFNDSQWETVDLSAKKESIDPMMGFSGFVPGWTAKGHSGYAGFAWYRIRVRISGADQPLSLLMPLSFDDSYQVFVNRRLIGSFGNFDRPVPSLYTNRARQFTLPAGSLQSSSSGNDTAVIAFRFYMAPRTLLQPMAGGLHAPPVLGLSSVITAAYHVAWEELYRSVSSSLAMAILFAAFALLILMLYVFDRTETILLWPVAACGLWVLNLSLIFFSETTQVIDALQSSILLAVIAPALAGAWLMTWRAYFGLQSKKWMRNTILILVLWSLAANLLFQILSLGGSIRQGLFAAYAINNLATGAAELIMVVLIAYFGFRRPQRESWVLFLALSFYALNDLYPVMQLLHVRTTWFPFGIVVPLVLITFSATLFCFSFVLLRHFRNSQRRQQTMVEDVKQAQEVQRVLIPEKLPHIPGFTVETVYIPASEVGGDFFHVSPAEDGSLLIVVGDVSGKGLKAAMTVSTIVGALRNERERQPAKVLSNLNRVLHGHITGFATCTAALIDADGSMTLANAGNLAPYRNGKELIIEPGLPLGILPDTTYSETTCQLDPEDRLTFLSDGVVEATNPQRELFGFDRTQAISNQSAKAIAEAAKQFGQHDDISVLSITRIAVLAETAPNNTVRPLASI